MSNLTDLINNTRIQDRFSNPYGFISELQDAWTWQKDLADSSGVMAGVNMVMKSMALQNRYADLNNNLFATISQIQNNPALKLKNTLFDSLTRINAYQQSVNKIFDTLRPPFSSTNQSNSNTLVKNEFNSTLNIITEDAIETNNIDALQHVEYVVENVKEILHILWTNTVEIVFIKFDTLTNYINEQISSISLKDILLIIIKMILIWVVAQFQQLP